MWTTSVVQGRLDVFSDMMSIRHRRNDITEMTSAWGHYDINGLSHLWNRLVYKGARPPVEDFLFSFLLGLSEKQLQRRLLSIYWIDQWIYFSLYVTSNTWFPLFFHRSTLSIQVEPFCFAIPRTSMGYRSSVTPAKFPRRSSFVGYLVDIQRYSDKLTFFSL